MLHIAVLEDSVKDYAELSGHLSRFSRETGTEMGIRHFEDGLSLFDEGSAQYDIIFMDIEMPLMNGMEAARRMRAENSRSILIFTTNVAQYALQGYEVDAMDYLLKPIGYFNLSMKLRKAISRLQREEMSEERVSIQTPDGVRVIPVQSIAYVEVNQHQLTYHADQDITVRATMKSAAAQLPSALFAQCSSSYLVNLRRVTGIRDDDVLVRTGKGVERLPMSRRMKKDFSTALMQLLAKGGGGA